MLVIVTSRTHCSVQGQVYPHTPITGLIIFFAVILFCGVVVVVVVVVLRQGFSV